MIQIVAKKSKFFSRFKTGVKIVGTIEIVAFLGSYNVWHRLNRDQGKITKYMNELCSKYSYCDRSDNDTHFIECKKELKKIQRHEQFRGLTEITVNKLMVSGKIFLFLYPNSL